MKTLLFLLNNRRDARKSILTAINMAKILDVNLKIIHISFPKPLSAPGVVVNLEMLHINPEDYSDKNINAEIDKELEDLKKDGLIEKEHIIEHHIGVPLFILKNKYDAGEFDYLALYHEEENTPFNTPSIPIILLRNLPCPTLVLPFNFEPKGFGEIIYTSDYQEEDIAAIQELLELLPSGSVSQLDIMHLTDEIDFQQELLAIGFENLIKRKTNFDECSCFAKTIKSKDEISEIVNQVATNKQADLIVVLKENRNLIQKVFYRSFTEKMLRHLHFPLLVLHQKDIL